MRVDIKHREKTEGWLSKKTYHVVDLTVTLSEEEKQIVKQRNLGGVVILERGVPADRKKSQFKGIENVFDLRILKVLRGETDSYAFVTPLEAKEYDAKLRAVLPELKEYIMGNAAIEQKTDSFEL